MKVELLGPLDLKSLVSDLSYVGSFIRLAYNGVAGETELQIKVFNIVGASTKHEAEELKHNSSI